MFKNRINCVLTAVILLVGVSSCTKDVSSIGSNFIDGNVNLIAIDTFSVKLSSFLLDSVVTSNTNIALVGGNSDQNYFGTTFSKSYIILSRPSIYQLAGVDPVYDSIVFIMTYNGYYYGDTLPPFKMSLLRVNQDIDFLGSNTKFYNTNSFGFDTVPKLGEMEFFPQPKKGGEIRMYLSDAFGNELLDKFVNHSDDIATLDQYLNYFKGVVLYPETTNAILGLSLSDTAMRLKLYYHDKNDVLNKAQSITMKPFNTNKQFNEISANRNNTLTSSVSTEPLSSESTGNCSFVQGGTGMVTRVDFPSLKDVMLSYPNVDILKAELIVQPIEDVDITTFPKSLNLYYSNRFNDFLHIVNDLNGLAETGNLNIDEINPENSTYTWDVTTFVKTILGTNSNQLNGLLIVPNDFSNSFDHVVIADPIKSHYRTKLKLYLASHD